jgi:F-type H+-transporting ATPase subunit delta
MKLTRKAKRAARQLFQLAVVDGRVDDGRARRIAKYLAGSGKRGGLAVLSGFQRLVRLDRERHTAVVESATTLSDDVRDGVRKGLAGIYGPGLDASFAQNPELIAGMRIKVGSHVYDGSVRGKLDALERRL